MIVADRKSLKEIKKMVEDCSNILILGCKGCVTVCNIGGIKEVEILASIIRIARKKDNNPIKIDCKTLERQCDPEYIENINDILNYDSVISMACGVGPQFLSEVYPLQKFYPAINTKFIGGAIEHGIWEERCAGCGNCIIHKYDGLCPISRCSKSIQHGPCGGSSNGKCEISKDVECVWDTIIRKKIEQGHLEDLRNIHPAKNWQTARDGGPRKSIREELVNE